MGPHQFKSLVALKSCGGLFQSDTLLRFCIRESVTYQGLFWECTNKLTHLCTIFLFLSITFILLGRKHIVRNAISSSFHNDYDMNVEKYY